MCRDCSVDSKGADPWDALVAGYAAALQESWVMRAGTGGVNAVLSVDIDAQGNILAGGGS